jgi:uncharacterized protein YceK
MKKLLIILSVGLLTGCSTLQDLWVASYDTNEYALVNKIRTIAQTSKTCDESTVKNLYLTTVELKNFSQYLPRNRQNNELNADLLRLVTELYDKEPPIGSAYCKAKLNIIEKTAERIQQVTGSKPK